MMILKTKIVQARANEIMKEFDLALLRSSDAYPPLLPKEVRLTRANASKEITEFSRERRYTYQASSQCLARLCVTNMPMSWLIQGEGVPIKL